MSSDYYIDGPCNCAAVLGNVCRHRPTLRTFRVVGRTKTGLVSITIEAIDSSAATYKATRRGVDVQSCVPVLTVYG